MYLKIFLGSAAVFDSVRRSLSEMSQKGLEGAYLGVLNDDNNALKNSVSKKNKPNSNTYQHESILTGSSIFIHFILLC